jgi:hypothetical protein
VDRCLSVQAYVPGHLDDKPVDNLDERDEAESEAEAEAASNHGHKVEEGSMEDPLILCGILV